MSDLASLMFYLLTFLFMILLAFIIDNSKDKRIKSVMYFLIYITLTLIMGLRYNVGSDYMSYTQIYGSYEYLELGNRLLYQLANLISNSSQTIIMLYAALTNYFYIKSIKNIDGSTKRHLIFATYLFLYFPFSLNVIRQSLAMAICVYSVTLLLKEKKKLAIAYTLIAALFHSSALIFIPYYVVILFSKEENLKKNILRLTIFLMVGILGALYLVNRTGLYIKYFNYLSNFSLNNLDKYLLISYIPFVIMIILSQKINTKSTLCLSGMTLSGILLEILLSSTEGARLGIYFSLLSIFIIPELIETSKGQSKKSLKVMYYVYLVTYFIFVYYLHGRAAIFPYRFIFFY